MSKTEYIKFRVTEKEKEFIKEKADKIGFKSVTAFLKASAEDHFTIEMDMGDYRDLTAEINYIGKNINNLVHHIFSVGSYSDYDLKEIQRLQKEILKQVSKEYDYLSKLRKKYKESNMSLKDKETLIEELKKNEIEIPKRLVLEEIYEQIRSDVLYLCQMIEDSPDQEEGISDYVYEYLFDGILLRLDEKTLIKFADDIYMFSEKIKMKMLNIMNVFEDDDWYDLKDILDKYENI